MGRPPCAIWGFFTDAVDAHKLTSVTCKHCQRVVATHRHSETAETHLRRCVPFRELILTLPPEQRPHWFSTGKKSRYVRKDKRQQQQQASAEDTSLSALSDSPQTRQQYQQLSPPPVLKRAKTSTTSTSTPTRDAPSFDNRRFQELLAMHYYTTETPFNRVDDSFLVQAIRVLRSNAQLPTSESLGSALLETSFKRVQDKTLAVIRSGGSTSSCIVTTSTTTTTTTTTTTATTTNASTAKGVNVFLAVPPSKTFFLQTESYEIDQVSSERIASSVSKATKSVTTNGGRVAGAVADSHSKMNQRAWHMLETQYPSRFFHGCVLDALHSMVRRIFDPTVSSSSSSQEFMNEDDEDAMELPASPFKGSLDEFASDCRDVVAFFSSQDQFKAQLEDLQQASGARALVGFPRWSSAPGVWSASKLQECFQALLESEFHLTTVVHDRQFVPAHGGGSVGGNSAPSSVREHMERQRIKNIVLRPDFAANLEKSIGILQPLDKVILKFQYSSNKSPPPAISEVIPAFRSLSEAFRGSSESDSLGISGLEVNYLCALVDSTLRSLKRAAHDFGYLLDPRYLGDGLSLSERRKIENELFSFPVDDDDSDNNEAEAHAPATLTEEDSFVLAEEYSNFVAFARADRSAGSTHYLLLVRERRTPLQFWQLDGDEWPRLQKIAIKVFSMVASSAPARDLVRSNSDKNFVEPPTEETQEKLAYIQINAPQITGSASAQRAAVASQQAMNVADERYFDVL